MLNSIIKNKGLVWASLLLISFNSILAMEDRFEKEKSLRRSMQNNGTVNQLNLHRVKDTRTGNGTPFIFDVSGGLKREYDSRPNAHANIINSAGVVATAGIKQNERLSCRGCGTDVAHASYSDKGGGTTTVFLSQPSPDVAVLHGLGNHVKERGLYEAKFCDGANTTKFSLNDLRRSEKADQLSKKKTGKGKK